MSQIPDPRHPSGIPRLLARALGSHDFWGLGWGHLIGYPTHPIARSSTAFITLFLVLLILIVVELLAFFYFIVAFSSFNRVGLLELIIFIK